MPEAKETGNPPADTLQHAFDVDLSAWLGGASDSLQPEVRAILKPYPEFYKDFILDKAGKKSTVVIEAIKHGGAPDGTRAILSAVPEEALKEYINQKDEYGNSALYYALRGMPGIAVELLHKGADTRHLTPDNENLLHIFAAAEYPVDSGALKAELKKPQYAELLKEQNRVGDLPLHAARTPEAVTFLLKDLHADPKALNADYKTAPTMLVDRLNGMDMEFSYFGNNAPDLERIVPRAPRWNEAARISTLIAAHAEAGVDLGREKRMEALGDMFHFTEYEKNTKIFSAAAFADAHERILKAQEEMNKTHLNEVMKSSDKDALNRKDEYERTPLYYAMRYQRFDDAEKLIARGAHLTDLDENKDNIYHLAALYADDKFTKSSLAHALKNHSERDTLLAQRNYFPDMKTEDCDLPAKDCQSVAAVKFFLEIQPPPMRAKESPLQKFAQAMHLMPEAVKAPPENDPPPTMFDEMAVRLTKANKADAICDILLTLHRENPDVLVFNTSDALYEVSHTLSQSAVPPLKLSDDERKTLHHVLIDKALDVPNGHAMTVFNVINGAINEAIRTNDIAFLKSLRPAIEKNGMLEMEEVSYKGLLHDDEIKGMLSTGNTDMLNALFDSGFHMNTTLITLDAMEPPIPDAAARRILSQLHGKLSARGPLPMEAAIHKDNLPAISRYVDFDLVYPPGQPEPGSKTMTQLAQEKFNPEKKENVTHATEADPYHQVLQRGYELMQRMYTALGLVPFEASKGNEYQEIIQKLFRYDLEHTNRLYSEQHNISKADAAPGPVALAMGDMSWNAEEFRPQATLPPPPRKTSEARYPTKNTV